MRVSFPSLIPAAMGLLIGALGCGGGSSYSAGSMSTSGSMNVTLVDGPTADYQQINLNIQSVQVHTSASAGETGWVTLSSPNKTVDLLKLRGGVVETLAAGATLGAGQYQMMRLVLGSGNTLKLADGSTVALDVPSGQQTGVKLPLSFTVNAGTTDDVWIDFDGAHSIQVTATGGGSARYMLRPVVHAFEKVATGSISGTVKVAGSLGLAGAEVMAESVDASGNVTILRTTTTDASGNYTLNLLPVNQTFYVVTQPVVAGLAYTAQASSAITLTSASATATFNADLSLSVGTGGVNGTLTPTASVTQSDTVLLLKAFGPVNLAVGSSMGVVATSETYTFLLVPTGTYQAQAVRSTLNADGSTTLTRSTTTAAFAVSGGASSVENISF